MIVCGLEALGLRVVEVLRSSTVDVVVVDDDPDPRLVAVLARWGVPFLAESPRLPDGLVAAGLHGARAVVSVDTDDLHNLETALVVRTLRPEVRIIVQMANPAVSAAVTGLVRSGAALDVAALSAPSLVQACLGGGQLHLTVEGVDFAITETRVTKPGTLRSVFGDLVPVAVVGSDSHLEICPGRDQAVGPGDRVSVLGTPAELADALGARRAVIASGGASHRRDSAARVVASLAQGGGRNIGLLVLGLVLLVTVSSAVLRLFYRPAGGGSLPLVSAVYFTVETISTVGYGDFSFAAQSVGLRVFAIALIILGVTSIATLFALITDLLFSRRVIEALGRGRVTRMRGHVVVVGLGAVGLRVVEDLIRYEVAVVVIERDEDNRHLAHARDLGIPIIVGDATRARTLESANVAQASAVAVLTSADLTNLEGGLSVRDYLAGQGRDIPIVMRIFDRRLGRVIEESFAFPWVRSTAALAAPWFVGAALGLDILSTFYVEAELFLVAGLTVAPAGGLAGLAMQDLSARLRVIAIRRAAAPPHSGEDLEHPPRRATRFAAGDRAYLVGPYEELLAVLERDASESLV